MSNKETKYAIIVTDGILKIVFFASENELDSTINELKSKGYEVLRVEEMFDS